MGTNSATYGRKYDRKFLGYKDGNEGRDWNTKTWHGDSDLVGGRAFVENESWQGRAEVWLGRIVQVRTYSRRACQWGRGKVEEEANYRGHTTRRPRKLGQIGAKVNNGNEQ